MMKLKKLAAGLLLAIWAGMAPGQQPLPTPVQGKVVVQDGIEVRPMWRGRVLAPAQVVEQQSKQQYLQLMQQAQQKGVLVPASDAQVVRLRAIAKRIIPYTTRWNPEASKWEWQVNLLASPEVNVFCMPGGRVAF